MKLQELPNNNSVGELKGFFGSFEINIAEAEFVSHLDCRHSVNGRGEKLRRSVFWLSLPREPSLVFSLTDYGKAGYAKSSNASYKN